MKAPSFNVKKWGSEEVISLDQYAGKALLLTFWVSWCPDCRRDLHNKQQLFNAMNTDDVDVLMIHVPGREPDESEAEKYIAEQGYTLPIASDSGTQWYDKYRCMSAPTTFVINAEGEIVGNLNDKAGFQDVLKLLGKVLEA